MTTNVSDLPLPYGWIEQTHEHGKNYYVDTKANPPRSIFVHPYKDEQYLDEHPEVREKLRPENHREPSMDGSDGENRRDSYGDAPPSYCESLEEESGGSSSSQRKEKGFLGKLKDVAAHMKEEIEAEKKRDAELQAQTKARSQQRRHELAGRASHEQFDPLERSIVYVSDNGFITRPTAMDNDYRYKNS